MDPLQILHEELREEILSYLVVRDIKQASLVSKDWYNIIGKSKLCMEKLCIKKYGGFETYESILNSNRQYQKLTLLSNQSELKKNTKFLRVLRYIVEKFSESLQFLRISQDLKLKVNLTKLKELQFDLERHYYGYFVNLITSNGIITKAKHLKKLSIKYENLDDKSLKYIKDALKKNESLKVLEIKDINIIRELNQDDMKFKLDEIHLNRFPIKHKSTIQQFLSTQMSSLQVIQSPFDKQHFIYSITKFPKLHTLILIPSWYEYNDYNRNEEPLSDGSFIYPHNGQITKLIFHADLYFDKTQTLFLSTIISKLPNLKEIQKCYLTPNFLPLLSNCPSLKVVKYKHLSYDFTQTQRNQIAQHERINFIQTEF
ncbi:hypothetical protein ACKWTF_003377 [Chironomus riparius]